MSHGVNILKKRYSEPSKAVSVKQKKHQMETRHKQSRSFFLQPMRFAVSGGCVVQRALLVGKIIIFVFQNYILIPYFRGMNNANFEK